MSWMMSFFEMTDGGVNQFHLTYYNTFTFTTFTFLLVKTYIQVSNLLGEVSYNIIIILVLHLNN